MTGKPVRATVSDFPTHSVSNCSDQARFPARRSGEFLRTVTARSVLRLRHKPLPAKRPSAAPESTCPAYAAQPLALHQPLQKAGNVKSFERMLLTQRSLNETTDFAIQPSGTAHVGLSEKLRNARSPYAAMCYETSIRLFGLCRGHRLARAKASGTSPALSRVNNADTSLQHGTRQQTQQSTHQQQSH